MVRGQPPVSFVLDMAKKDNVRSASFDNAGTRFAVVASDGVVRLFVVPPLTNAAVGYPASGLELIGHRGVVTSVAFSSSSERLVTGSYDGTVRLWRYDGVQGAWASQALQAGFPQPAAEDAGAAPAAPAKPLRVLVTVWTCDDAKVVVSVLGGALQVRCELDARTPKKTAAGSSWCAHTARDAPPPPSPASNHRSGTRTRTSCCTLCASTTTMSWASLCTRETRGFCSRPATTAASLCGTLSAACS